MDRYPRWRRLCIDIDDDGKTIGGSVEYYSERKFNRVAVAVMNHLAATGRDKYDLLDELDDLGWPNPGLPFNFRIVGGED